MGWGGGGGGLHLMLDCHHQNDSVSAQKRNGESARERRIAMNNDTKKSESSGAV